MKNNIYNRSFIPPGKIPPHALSECVSGHLMLYDRVQSAFRVPLLSSKSQKGRFICANIQLLEIIEELFRTHSIAQQGVV
jgi:hypothetical protein